MGGVEGSGEGVGKGVMRLLGGVRLEEKEELERRGGGGGGMGGLGGEEVEGVGDIV